jgi:hypothetical protein
MTHERIEETLNHRMQVALNLAPAASPMAARAYCGRQLFANAALPPRVSRRSRASASGPFCRQLFANLRVFSGLLVGIFALSRRKQGFESLRERQTNQ